MRNSQTLQLDRRTSESEKYIRLVPFSNMINNITHLQFYTNKYREVEPKNILGLGKVYLAPFERTVILGEETQRNIERNNIKLPDVLECVNSGCLSLSQMVAERRDRIG